MSRRPSDPTADLLGRLFEQALSVPREAQPAFIDEACGEHPELRDELTSLLVSHAAAPDFLERIREPVLAPALAALSRASLRRGRIIGRYEILEQIGSGGMGEVYKARDRILDRMVALKFLPRHRSADPGARSRLLAEARAASSLDHPNIAVVHEVGTAELDPTDSACGRLYIAMAYYPGETLGEKVARGPLPVREALDYAIQIVDGLTRAHEAEVVHRDIKPTNVVVSDRGQVRIVDFGVAMLAGAPGREGGQPGTAAYMSPEQARGAPVDHRTDLWSVGVLLYEMLAGVRPFGGDSLEAVARSVREDEPARLELHRPDVRPELAAVLSRCMAKDPARRQPTAAALLAELRSVFYASSRDTGKNAGGEPRIVVLPFVNISRDPGDEYLSVGLTEEVIGELSHIRSLTVISRASAMRLEQGRDVRDLARDLGVRYVLEGGVRRAGRSLRISTRFVDARNGDVVGAHSFDGTIGEILEIQERVARAVAESLRIRLSPEESRALAERPIRDARAYESYLRARYEAWRFSKDGLARAQRYMDAALAIVGDNELIYGTLGHIRAMYLEAGIDPGAVALDRVDELAEKIFTLNPSSARGHWLEAFSAFQRGDMRAAIVAGERSHAFTPDDPDTLLLLGYLYAHVGRNVDARTLLERAVELDPLTPLTQCMPGFVSVLEGRFADAAEPYRRLYQMDPESPFAAVTFAWVLAYDRRFDEATTILDDASTRYAGTAFASWATSLAHAIRGELDAAASAISPEFSEAAQHSEMFARALAQCCALAGRNADALHWLEREIDLGMLNYPFLAEHDWFLNGIRGEPRFRALLERVRAASASLN